jgi:ribonuclease BN (tRNA processing enzyme)
MGGLAPFLFATKHAPDTRKRTQPLVICGPAGFTKLLSAIDESYNYELFRQPFPLKLLEVSSTDPFEILPGLEAKTFSTPHTNESFAIRLTDKNGSVVVYTSDTGYTEGLIEFARGASIFLMECSFHRNKPIEKHLELREAMQIAAAAQPRKLVLTHLYPEWDGINLANEAKKFWAGDTIEAHDGLRIEF